MISSLSLVLPGFEGIAIYLDVSRFLAIIVNSNILGLALTSRISELYFTTLINNISQLFLIQNVFLNNEMIATISMLFDLINQKARNKSW